MALSPGDKLGIYDIVAPIGAGGMGEVYRARDTKLGRQVAIKILPATWPPTPPPASASAAKPRPPPRSTTLSSARSSKSAKRATCSSW
ncbi:MAG: hypothetical protein FJW38_11485 [Acidobacteria bacterium]|nr:hypothetical protein [Acidobacteriota bacterium]